MGSNFPDSLIQLVPRYVEQQRQNISQAWERLDELDYEELARFGHTLTGNAPTFGFNSLSRLGGELNHAALSHQVDKIREVLQELAEEVQRIEGQESLN